MTKSPIHKTLRKGALHAAPKLLGCELIIERPSHTIRVMITETEAYTQDDPASHTFRGQTPRNAAMFLGAGHAYIYRSYGIHLCLNIVTGEPGNGEAVLIRSVVPIRGEDAMIDHRKWHGKNKRDLCNGPGKVCQALALTINESSLNLLEKNWFRLAPGSVHDLPEIKTTPRIGITKAVEKPWRFLIDPSSLK